MSREFRMVEYRLTLDVDSETTVDEASESLDTILDMLFEESQGAIAGWNFSVVKDEANDRDRTI